MKKFGYSISEDNTLTIYTEEMAVISTVSEADRNECEWLVEDTLYNLGYISEDEEVSLFEVEL